MTATQAFDGTLGVRGESVRWDVTDVDNNPLGQLMVDKDSTPKMSNDTGRAIRRVVSNLRVLPRPLVDVDTWHVYADDLTTLTMRVHPYWVLASGDEYPLGVFAWGDDSTEIYSWGQPRPGTLVDLCVTLDQSLEASIGYATGMNIGAALTEQADAAGVGARSIEVTDRVVGSPVAWAAGRDTRLQVMAQLCALAAFLPPYFDNEGTLVCRSAPVLSEADPDFFYGTTTGLPVIAGSPLSTSDILNAPNRYVVISGNSDQELVGVYDIPDQAPNSFANTHIRRVATFDLQGLTDQTAADDAAHAAYVSDASTYSQIAFDTPPDPRHDTFDVVDFDGTRYFELGWDLAMRHGATMTHTCRSGYG